MSRNVTQPVFNRCQKCNEFFSTKFVDRKICVKCKPTTQKELDSLLNFEGGKIVKVEGAVTSLVV